MDSNFKNNIENINVGIFRNGNSYTAEIIFGCDGNCGGGRDVARNVSTACHVSTMANEQPVFVRSFSEMVLAIGYCNVINQLSNESVERIMEIDKNR